MKSKAEIPTQTAIIIVIVVGGVVVIGITASIFLFSGIQGTFSDTMTNSFCILESRLSSGSLKTGYLQQHLPDVFCKTRNWVVSSTNFDACPQTMEAFEDFKEGDTRAPNTYEEVLQFEREGKSFNPATQQYTPSIYGDKTKLSEAVRTMCVAEQISDRIITCWEIRGSGELNPGDKTCFTIYYEGGIDFPTYLLYEDYMQLFSNEQGTTHWRLIKDHFFPKSKDQVKNVVKSKEDNQEFNALADSLEKSLQVLSPGRMYTIKYFEGNNLGNDLKHYSVDFLSFYVTKFTAVGAVYEGVTGEDLIAVPDYDDCVAFLPREDDFLESEDDFSSTKSASGAEACWAAVYLDMGLPELSCPQEAN